MFFLSVLLGLVFPLVNLLFVFPLFDHYLGGRLDPQTVAGVRRLVVHPNLTFAAVGLCLAALVFFSWRRVVRADRELRLSQARLKRILDATPAGILIVDHRTGKVVAANPAAAALAGLEAEQLQGLGIRRLFGGASPEGAPPACDLMREACGEGRLWTVRRGPLPVWGSAGDLLLDGTHQRIISFVDLSALKQAEQSVIRAERLAAVGTMTAGIAHEFNNAHQIALGFAELALRRPGIEAGLKKNLESIHSALGRARDISRQLLAFSGESAATVAELRLETVLTGVLNLIRRELESSGVVLVADLKSVPAVLMDGGQIGQVALNLLINAQHALLERPQQKITVRTGADEAGAFFSIADTGCGIPLEAQALIFSPFFSTKGEFAGTGSPQAKVKGTGLGLSVSQAIVQNHGGSIQVISVPGQGSTFTVRLPLAKAPDRPAPPPEPASPGPENISPDSTAPQAPGTILVLDDEAEVREVLRQFLEGRGFQVLETYNGAEALEWALTRRIDVALVDLQMPGMNGFQFLRRLALIPAQQRPAALVLTGTMGAESILAREGLGWAGVIQKPFEFSEVENRLVALCGARRTAEMVPGETAASEPSPRWVLPGPPGAPQKGRPFDH